MKPHLVALALGLFAAASPPARAEQPPAPGLFTGGLHVVVLGSSTAYGMGPAHPESAWVNRFRTAAQAENPARTVTNLAVPGYTTYHLMPDGFVPPAGRPAPDPDHNITKALSLGADAILINLPSNDAINGWSVGTQLANYDIMLAAAGATPVWISTTQPRNTTSATRANLIAMKDSTLARWGEMAMDFWTTIANPDGTINAAWDSGDGVHLNDAAHGILFARADEKNVWDAITPTAAPDVAGPSESLRAVASPNPFRRGTVIRYALPAAGHVALELYDLQGRRVRTLVDADQPPGAHEVSVEDAALPNGVYFYRLRDGREENVGKLIRVR